MQKLRASGHELKVCYEAGSCGFGIARRLVPLHVDCVVIAPSLIPKKSGDRQKNDRRDAAKLARLHRAGELTAVHISDPTDEALRAGTSVAVARKLTVAVWHVMKGHWSVVNEVSSTLATNLFKLATELGVETLKALGYPSKTEFQEKKVHVLRTFP